MQKKTTQMRPNQFPPVSIFIFTPTTSLHFAGYPYTTETQKAAKVSNKNSSFNWLLSILTELMNASHSTNIFTNSCHQISTNGKIPPHSHMDLQHPTIPLFALTRGWRSKRQLSRSFGVVIQRLSARLIKPNFNLGEPLPTLTFTHCLDGGPFTRNTYLCHWVIWSVCQSGCYSGLVDSWF